MRWIRRVAFVVLLLLALLAAALFWYARQALPVVDGVLGLPGARAEVRIERDTQGVPTIRAGSEHDLAWGLGVAHAQDRLWQMETHRRIGSGRLAEAFGPGALANDKFLRALGVRRAAQVQWTRLAPDTRELLQAYTDGVNAVLTAALRARPPEFIVLGVQPEPWTPVDSLSWALMMAWDLGGNWNSELLRLRLALQMPVHRIQQLMPPYPGDAPLPLADYAALYRSLKLGAPGHKQAWLDGLDRLAEAAPPSGVEGVGSNNWVLAGRRSATGAPLLANDPHLKLSTPALWYFARLEAPGFKVAGATLPGLPGVVLGANEHIAWGFTNTAPDVQDLYLEQVDPADPMRYRTPEGWATFATVTEIIRVKGQPDVMLTVRTSRHGPVISDAGNVDDLLGPTGSASVLPMVLAMRWTALDPDNDALSPALAFNRAKSVDEFVAATRGWVAPMQSMVVADRAGRIGMVAPGRVPQRGPGHDLMGYVPAPGWEARYDWIGFVPADETPRVLDPAEGFIATANQRIVAPDYPHFLTSEWALPWRQQRIESVLRSRPQHTLDDMARLQLDVRSLAVPTLLPWLLKAQSAHPLAAAAQAQLAGFDGEMAADKAAPLIFWAWQRQLSQGVFADDAGPALWKRSLQGRSYTDALGAVLAASDNSWCDDLGTAAPETCVQQSDAAFSRALDELQARFGADPARWHWGQAHQARSEHRPFSRVKALAGLFELRVPVGGDTYTVNVSRVGLRPDETTGELYLDEHGPSLRALYDLGNPAQSRFMHSTGQSGIVFSPLYRSFAEPWRRGDYLPLWGDGQPAKYLLVLPAAGR
jgi:penicillin G amidase